MVKTIKQKMLLAAGLLAASGVAIAQESPSQTAMQSIADEAGNMIDSAWPIVVAVVVAGIAIKLFKKFASKAT